MIRTQEPIRVVYITDNLMRNSLPGGVLRHINYANALRERSVELHLVTARTDTCKAWQERKGVTVHAIAPHNEGPKQGMRAQLLRAAYDLAAKWPEGTRVVFSEGVGVSFNIIFQIWGAKWRGIPTVFNSGMLPDPPPAGRLAALWMKTVMQLFLRGHAFFIPQTIATRRLYSDYYGRLNGRVEVIGNGVDCDRFAPVIHEERRKVRSRLGVSDDALLVVCISSVIPRKGTHLLLQAWQRVLECFPKARLAIVGTLGKRSTFLSNASTLDDYADKIRSLISALSYPDSVILLGQQLDDVEVYLGVADVFALASSQEGLPNVVLEAMASALPCVLSAYHGFPADGEEFGVNGIHFRRTNYDPASIADCIIGLLGDSDARRAMGIAARNWMKATQNQPLILDRWAAVVKRVAGTQLEAVAPDA